MLYPKPKTHVALVIDESGSMSSIRRETVQAFNNAVQSIRDNAVGQEVTVTLVAFANRPKVLLAGIPPKDLKDLSNAAYNPSGGTALFDAIGETVETLEELPFGKDPETCFLMVVITDGEENGSRKFNAHLIKSLFSVRQGTDRWTFAIHLPPGYAKSFESQFGIPKDNIREWEATREGTQSADVATQSGLAGYLGARKSGQRSVKQFFVTTDLSKVDADAIKAKLVDQSGRFKPYEVKAEAVVKEFVEGKTKKPYVIGSTYYLLMKKEKVQASKNILIMEKGSSAIWGGPEARKLVGIPDGVDALVNPGNHAGYDVYVASTSVNRKLPRGTKVLVDLTHTKNSKETWDSSVIKPKEINTLAAN